MTAADPGFDRLRRRTLTGEEQLPARTESTPDHQGKRALFSSADQPASFGAVTVTCSSCGERSVVSARQALLLALPSLHLPVVKPDHWSWMRCPACRRRTWVQLGLQL